MKLDPIDQGDTDNSGTLVRDIIASAEPPDRITDADVGALEGIMKVWTSGTDESLPDFNGRCDKLAKGFSDPKAGFPTDSSPKTHSRKTYGCRCDGRLPDMPCAGPGSSSRASGE
jgi:hypothetical protein